MSAKAPRVSTEELFSETVSMEAKKEITRVESPLLALRTAEIARRGLSKSYARYRAYFLPHVVSLCKTYGV
jgi:hypothetical protein